MVAPNRLSSFMDWFSRLLNPRRRRRPRPPRPTPTPPPSTPSLALTPMYPRVLMVVYNPIVDPATGRKLIESAGWNDPDALAAGYIADIREASGGLVHYRIVRRTELNEIPVKADQFQYYPQDYIQALRAGAGFHAEDAVDYESIVENLAMLERVTANEFDEVWLFGGPYFGFSESVMAGKGAFFCNGYPVPNTEQCPRRFVIMGFNYQRGIGEMLEDLGHRAEFTLARVFGAEQFLGWAYAPGRDPRASYEPGDREPNLFERFCLYDQLLPGHANVGLMHFAPNSLRDYDWANPRPAPSCCDDWLAFPNLPDPPNYRPVTPRDWGGEIRGHHKWWFAHLPKAAGTTDGIPNNWWSLVVDPNLVK